MTFIAVIFIIYANGTSQTLDSKGVYDFSTCVSLVDRAVHQVRQDFPEAIVTGNCYEVHPS